MIKSFVTQFFTKNFLHPIALTYTLVILYIVTADLPGNLVEPLAVKGMFISEFLQYITPIIPPILYILQIFMVFSSALCLRAYRYDYTRDILEYVTSHMFHTYTCAILLLEILHNLHISDIGVAFIFFSFCKMPTLFLKCIAIFTFLAIIVLFAWLIMLELIRILFHYGIEKKVK